MIVFDASTLILLARIELLELFIAHTKVTLAIPMAVHNEILVPGKEGLEEIVRFLGDRIAIKQVSGPEIPAKLKTDFHIDQGEAEAISLALEGNDRIVATDDRNAIKACKLLKLGFITAPAALVLLNEKGFVGRSKAEAKLVQLASIGRYRPSIIDDIRQRIKGV